MKITYENIPATDEGKNFKTEARLVVLAVFASPRTPELFARDIARLTEDLKNELSSEGYVYNRANLTLDPVKKHAQGIICAVKGPAGDGPTLDKWAAGGMVARFTLQIQNGKIWAGAKP